MAEVFDIAAFRAAFPAFENEIIYPDALIQSTADAALCFLGDHGCGCDTLSWQLMVAHMLTLNDRLLSGNTGTAGMVTGASIDKVSVTITAPPAQDAYEFWLASTPYGLQILALLSKCSAGGVYVGGRAERSAFRSVGGRFPNRGRVL